MTTVRPTTVAGHMPGSRGEQLRRQVLGIEEIVRQAAPSWAILVRNSVVAVDGVEGLAEVVGMGSAAVMACRPAGSR
jgi:hypothetical protein